MNKQQKNTFNEMSKYDEIAIELLKEELVSDKILHVIPVSKDPFFYKPDIDLLIVTEENERLRVSSVEVKVDSYPSINGVKKIFLETVANNKKFAESCGMDAIGNALTSKSDYFLYYFVKMQEYLVIPTQRMQDWLRITIPKGVYEVKSSATYSETGEFYFSSYGLLVPINVLIEECGAKLCRSATEWETVAKKLNIKIA